MLTLDQILELMRDRVEIKGAHYPRLVAELFPELIRLMPKGIGIDPLKLTHKSTAHELWVLLNLLSVFSKCVNKAYGFSSYGDLMEGMLVIKSLKPPTGLPLSRQRSVMKRYLPVTVLLRDVMSPISIWYQAVYPPNRVPDLMICFAQPRLEDIAYLDEFVHMKLEYFKSAFGINGVIYKRKFRLHIGDSYYFNLLELHEKFHPFFKYGVEVNPEFRPDVIVECKESALAYKGKRIQNWDDYLAMKPYKAKLLISTINPLVNVGDFILIKDNLDKNSLKQQISDVLSRLDVI